MISCQEAAVWIPLYLDDELAPNEIGEFEAHLKDCGACQQKYEQLRSVVDNVRAARPLYEPSAESERRVGAMVRAHAHDATRARFLAAGIAAAILLAAPLAYLWLSQKRADSFSEFAAGSHIRYANGAVPLDVRSAEPEAVSRWFAPRLPFHFKLPNYVNEPGAAKRYSLAGARLMQYRDTDVAYLAYTMNQRPISLLVASADRVRPAGGQTFRTSGIDFHFSSDRGLRLITWMDRGLSYALVSDLDVTGAESCVICHGSPADRRKIQTLPH
ncbi:MAG TPA: zf-HC2 domain-containing protein [Bryobacteraceae bacterium]|nr:zf-HC2 domain-containing protein [Bryobacteraceae bacterium]